MKNFGKVPWLFLPFLVLVLWQNAFSDKKILVIVETNAYGQIYQNVTQYVNDIVNYDNKKAQCIIWTNSSGNNFMQCKPLWDTLQAQYFYALNSGDALEGAVLIGDIPVPIWSSPHGYIPLDQYYMDIADMSTGTPQAYANTPFVVDYGGYFTGDYGTYQSGDSHYDIWISRINASFLSGGIRQCGTVLDEYAVDSNYLAKVHSRMTSPANVPSRGFAMGGPVDWSLHDDLGQYFQLLNLPWFAEFTGGDNSSFNWISQLLAGPRGCLNDGGFNGDFFPTWHSRRYCIYDQFGTVYVPNNPYPTYQIVGSSDTLGWEWAGMYGHSSPAYTDFFSNEDGVLSNGRFNFGTLGPWWGTNYLDTGGYNNGHLWYQDNVNNPNPYNYSTAYKYKTAQWRWKVRPLPPGGQSNGYNIYVYYVASPNNVNWIAYWLYQMYISGTSQHMIGDRREYSPGVTISPCNCDQNGENPGTGTGCCRPPNNDASTGQRSHYNNTLADPNWELIFSNLQFIPDSIVEVLVDNAGSQREYCPTVGQISGNTIIDAIRFISATDGVPDYNVDEIVDERDPLSGYPDVNNSPSTVFSTNGLFTADGINRGYEDMGDETGGDGFSKPQFFLTKACWINNFVTTHASIMDDPISPSTAIVKNIGNLYALGHNGLICMGTANDDCAAESKTSFTSALATGKSFGEAFLDQQNASWYHTCEPGLNVYALLGAGNLRSQPYIQYGAAIEQNRTIATTENINLNQPILIQNVVVNGSGNWTVTSNNSATPPGTHSEIVIRPETDLGGEVDIYAHP